VSGILQHTTGDDDYGSVPPDILTVQQAKHNRKHLFPPGIHPSNMSTTTPTTTCSTSSSSNVDTDPSPLPNGRRGRTSTHDDSHPYHRPRTIYLVRHGEAIHNVLEDQAQQHAREEALARGLSEQETLELVEERRQAVLHDPALRDAPLTDRGRQQAKDCALQLQRLIDGGITHAPTEAMVSPLSRTLETCHILLDILEPKIQQAHIRPEIQERKTQYPPDTPRRSSALFQYTQQMDRFVIDNISTVSGQDVEQECQARESKEMLRQRACNLVPLLLQMNRRHLLIVSHKGYLRELERGLLGLSPKESPLFGNGELRVYKVVFTKGDRTLKSLERLV
jgi:broad specificity phosphatase PhoE